MLLTDLVKVDKFKKIMNMNLFNYIYERWIIRRITFVESWKVKEAIITAAMCNSEIIVTNVFY